MAIHLVAGCKCRKYSMSEQHVMASLPAIAEGAATEEQLLVAEASSVSRNAELKKLRQDKREFIKVSGHLIFAWLPPHF